MNKEEMLEEVRRLKDECVSAIVSDNPKLRAIAIAIAEAEAKEFLVNNYAQILDILDDALLFVLNGGNLHGKG